MSLRLFFIYKNYEIEKKPDFFLIFSNKEKIRKTIVFNKQKLNQYSEVLEILLIF